MNDSGTYLSAARMGGAAVFMLIKIILGGLLTFVFGLGLILCFTEPSLKGDWDAALIVLIPSALLLWSGLRTRRDLKLARRYAAVFSADRDGLLPLEELERQTGRTAEQIRPELERLFRRCWFTGCTLRREPFAVELGTASKKGEPRFVTVVCPHCGGSTRLRAGSVGRCDYCDSALEAKES